MIIAVILEYILYSLPFILLYTSVIIASIDLFKQKKYLKGILMFPVPILVFFFAREITGSKLKKIVFYLAVFGIIAGFMAFVYALITNAIWY